MIENFFKLNAFKVRKKDKILFEKKVFELNSFHEQKSNFYKNISFFKKNSKKKKNSRFTIFISESFQTNYFAFNQ